VDGRLICRHRADSVLARVREQRQHGLLRWLSVCARIEGTMRFRHVSQRHSGVYQCIAQNSVSNVITSAARLAVTASAVSRQALNPRGQFIDW